MLKRWPGCYIPPLPPKQVVGNMDNNFVQERQRMLNYFLKGITIDLAILKSILYNHLMVLLVKYAFYLL